VGDARRERLLRSDRCRPEPGVCETGTEVRARQQAVADIYGTTVEAKSGKTDADLNPNKRRSSISGATIGRDGRPPAEVVAEESVTNPATGATRCFRRSSACSLPTGKPSACRRRHRHHRAQAAGKRCAGRRRATAASWSTRLRHRRVTPAEVPHGDPALFMNAGLTVGRRLLRSMSSVTCT